MRLLRAQRKAELHVDVTYCVCSRVCIAVCVRALSLCRAETSENSGEHIYMCIAALRFHRV